MEQREINKSVVINKFKIRTSENTWTKGEILFNEDNVKSIDISKKNGVSNVIFEGIVKEKSEYMPTFYYNLKKNIVEVFSCTCSYNEKGPCEHVVALFLMLIKKHFSERNDIVDLENIEFDKNISLLNQYLNDPLKQKNTIFIQFRLEIPDYDKNKIVLTDIQIRNTLFQIKYDLLYSLSEFLKCYKKETLIFGKYLKYTPDSYIEKHSEKFIDILQEILKYKMDNIIGQYEIELPEVLLKNLVPLFPHLCINYSTLESKPEISILKDKEDILINANGLKGWHSFTKNYMVHVDKFGLFRFISSPENSEGINFLQNLGSGDVKRIKQDRVNINKLIHKFRRFVDVRFSDTFKSDFFIPEKVEYGFLLDIQKEYLSASIEIIYDGKRKKDIPKEIITDIDAERNALIEAEEFLEFHKFTKTDNMNVYILEPAYEIYEFLAQKIRKFPPKCHIFYAESFQGTRFVSGNINMKISKSDNFNIKLISKELTNDEVTEIFLNKLSHTQKFCRLKNGSIINLENNKDTLMSIQYKLLGLRATKEEIMCGNFHRPEYYDFFLNDYCLTEKNMKPYLKTFSCGRFPLRNYQIYGVNWLLNMKARNLGGILADSMGLGKTLQILTFLYIQQKKTFLPSMIIVPHESLSNWKNEINKFFKKMKYTLITGTDLEREEKIKNIKPKEIVITTYLNITKDIEIYKNIKFENLILDEAQKLKNFVSPVFEAVSKIKKFNAFALTGVLIETYLPELWCIFSIIMPNYLGTVEEFRERYEVKSYLVLLLLLINPFILKRSKNDVEDELPEKIVSNIFIDMELQQKEIYESFAEEYRDRIFLHSKMDTDDIIRMITELRQICSYPPNVINTYKKNISSKELLLFDIALSLCEHKQKVIIFCHFIPSLICIKSNFKKKFRTYYINEKTNESEREQFIEEFNKKSSKINILFISLNEGIENLDITGADTIINYDPWSFNPLIETKITEKEIVEELEETLEEKNEKRKVKSRLIYNFITKQSVEEHIYNLKNKKKIIDCSIDDMISSLPRKELIKLLDT